jgi:signal transduction histidine kinase
MTTLPSIRQRLLRTLMLWSVIWTLAIAAAVWLAVHEEVNEVLDETLQAAAEVLSGALAQGTQLAQAAPIKPSGASAPEQFVWQVVRYSADNSASVVQASRRAPADALYAVPLRGFGDLPNWRVYGLPLSDGGRMLYVAQAAAERGEARFEVALSAALASLTIALLGHFWLRAKTRQELQPLQNLASQLEFFDPLKTDAGLGPAERQELQSVHDAINALGQRLARRVANERAFSGHAAHALRTPLAGMDAQLAVALRECPPEMTARLQQIRLASGRLQSVVASLLSLFKSGVELKREPIAIKSWLERLAPSGLQLHIAASGVLHADGDMLAAALLNVFDNALRCGARNIHVTMPDAHTLRLTDDGAGATAGHRLALEQALHTERYEGVTGLGLMLADIVARAHGGGLDLPKVDSGFAVEMRLAATIVSTTTKP